MATTVSRPRPRQLPVCRRRQGSHVLTPQSYRHQHPARARIRRVMGAANRAPGTHITGPDSAGGVGVMGRPNAAPRAYVMGGPDAGARFVDSLFTGGTTR